MYLLQDGGPLQAERDREMDDDVFKASGNLGFLLRRRRRQVEEIVKLRMEEQGEKANFEGVAGN